MTDIHAKLMNIEKQFQKLEQLNNTSSSSSSDSSTHLDNNSIDSSSTTSTVIEDATANETDTALPENEMNDGNQNVSKPHMNEKDAEMIREIIQKLKCVYGELLKSLVPITSASQRIKRSEDDDNFKQKYDALEAKVKLIFYLAKRSLT